MPILYVHGVGVRDKDQAGWEAVRPFLMGMDWPGIQGRLRRYVAPVLNRQHPEKVAIEQVFWGDLGASPLLPPLTQAPLLSPADLSPAALAEVLEERLRQITPVRVWPQVIQAAYTAAHDQILRQQWQDLLNEAAWNVLQKAAETAMRRDWAKLHPLEPWPLLAQLRQDVYSRLLVRVNHLRGPIENFLPYFMGDVMGYPLRRGTPQEPGPIPQRVLLGLEKMHAIKQQTGEPIIILTHSMGGQLMYDALSAYAPAQASLRGLEVDFWAATASQLGLFASLDLFVQPVSGQGILPPLDNLKYLWSVWSSSDFLSFQAGGAIPSAHDIAMPLTDDVFKAHMAYMTMPQFYRILASKVAAQLEQ